VHSKDMHFGPMVVVVVDVVVVVAVVVDNGVDFIEFAIEPSKFRSENIKALCITKYGTRTRLLN
jgi:hypothetical protein